MFTKRKRLLLYALLPLGSLLVMGASDYYQANKRCARVEVRLDADAAKARFMDEQDVRNLIHADNHLVNAPVGEIALAQVEDALYATNYVKQAIASLQHDGTLRVDLKLRKPVARFMDAAGRQFYLDAAHKPMPLSPSFSARVLLVRGHCVNRLDMGMGDFEYISDSLLALVAAIQADAALAAQISEIFVSEDGSLTLYPEFGGMSIEMGQPVNLNSKLSKLDRFYRKVLPHTGWDYYSRISLAYEGQIVARRARFTS